MTVKIGVKNIKTHPGLVILPKSLYQDGLDVLQFGIKQVPCHIIPGETKECQINMDLWEALLLPKQAQFKLTVSESALRLLPLIGCYTTHIQWGTQTPLGKETTFQEKWLELTREKGGVAFFFTDNQINWLEGTVRGLIHKEGKWSDHDFPLPDVIYDRIPNRAAEKRPSATQLKERLENKYQIPWFNPGFFDKWEIYKSLNQDPKVSLYLPETSLFSESDFYHFLETYKTIYLKPRRKSLGTGIIRVIETRDGEIDIRGTGTDRFNHQRLKSRIESWLSVQQLIGMPHSYILQRGINRIQHKGKAVDFRVHTNKNKMGDWELSALAAKQSGPRQITTHLSYGGEVLSLEELFTQSEAKETLSILKKAALNLSRRLDKAYHGQLGELGFDLGIDLKGRVWLFEINSKPRHHIFLSPSIRGQLNRVHGLWLDYCEYLTLEASKV